MNTKASEQETEKRLDILAHKPDLVKGLKQIAEVHGWTFRQAQYAVNKGRIPGVVKFGNTWIGSRREMLRPFVPMAAE